MTKRNTVPSRQMAFQMKGHEVLSRFTQVHDWYKEGKAAAGGDGQKVLDVINARVQDERERHMYFASWGAAMETIEKKKDIMKISQVIAWRGPDGKPEKIQIEFHR